MSSAITTRCRTCPATVTGPGDQCRACGQASLRGAASKLVRDRVPEIMGARWRGHIATGHELLAACAAKVAEEHDELRQAGTLEELVDLLEAVLALDAACLRLADQAGITAAAVEQAWWLRGCFEHTTARRRLRRQLRRVDGGLPMWVAILGLEMPARRAVARARGCPARQAHHARGRRPHPAGRVLRGRPGRRSHRRGSGAGPPGEGRSPWPLRAGLHLGGRGVVTLVLPGSVLSIS